MSATKINTTQMKTELTIHSRYWLHSNIYFHDKLPVKLCLHLKRLWNRRLQMFIELLRSEFCSGRSQSETAAHSRPVQVARRCPPVFLSANLATVDLPWRRLTAHAISVSLGLMYKFLDFLFAQGACWCFCQTINTVASLHAVFVKDKNIKINNN